MCWRSSLTAAAFQNRTTTSNTDKLPKVFYMPQVHSTGQEYQLAPGPFRRVGGTVGAFSDGAQMESRPCLLRISNFCLRSSGAPQTVVGVRLSPSILEMRRNECCFPVFTYMFWDLGIPAFKSEMHLKCLPTAQRLEAETTATEVFISLSSPGSRTIAVS